MGNLTLPLAHKPPPPDNCGTCTACCVIDGVPELGKPSYARCMHLRGEGQPPGCCTYETRPRTCSEFRCAWHLGMLGPRVDRRPDQCGIMFQIVPGDSGEWYLNVYEAVADAANRDRVNYLRDVILTSKLTRHLRFGQPAVRIIKFGADLPSAYPVSPRFAGGTCTPASFRNAGNAMIYDGRVRDVLIPTPEA